MLHYRAYIQGLEHGQYSMASGTLTTKQLATPNRTITNQQHAEHQNHYATLLEKV